MYYIKCFHAKQVLIIVLFVLLLLLLLQSLKPVEQNQYYGYDSSNFRGSEKLSSERTFSKMQHCKIIHVAIVCAGVDARHQVVTLLKSLLFYRKNSLHIHFLVDDETKVILSHFIQTWDIPDLTVSFYLVQKHIDKVAWIPNKHYSGVYGLLKIIILEILPSYIQKIILLDADLVFGEDIAKLWDQFMLFNTEEAIGLVENQSDWYLGIIWDNYIPWPALGRGFNTGVMLLDCVKLRKWKWNNKWQGTTRKVINDLGSTALADQDIINSVLKENPFLVHILPCKWNIQLSDHVKIELCYSNYSNDIGILHWNNRKKKRIRKTSLKFLQNIYQVFVDLNGDLVKKPVFNCNQRNSQLWDESFSEDSDDPCLELSESSSILHRTHLFYLPFEYSKTVDDVSIVVQLSFDRLPMLEKLCSFWNGPVSAAVFVSDFETSQLINFVSQSNVLTDRKNVAYHLVFRNSNEKIYPINMLRNVALQNAKTGYVFLCDVDFAPMPNLYEYIISHLSSAPITKQSALIVPAFESLRNIFAMPETKSQLLEELGKETVTTFRSYVWPQGHAATNFTTWKTAKKPYQVFWEPDFEPYVVVPKQICPLYHKSFTGYGWNKISHIMELDAAGFTFQVLPYGFVIHLPHPPSLDLLKYRSQPAYRECLNQAKLDFNDYVYKKYGKKYP